MSRSTTSWASVGFSDWGFTCRRRCSYRAPSTEAVVEQVLLNVRADGHAGAGSAGMMGVGNDEPARAAVVAGRSGNLGEGVHRRRLHGSGCIAIALLKNLPGATAIATDIRPSARRGGKERGAPPGRRPAGTPAGRSARAALRAPCAPRPTTGATVSPPRQQSALHPDSEWAEVPPECSELRAGNGAAGGSDGMDFLRRSWTTGRGSSAPRVCWCSRPLRRRAQRVLELVRSAPAHELRRRAASHDLEGFARVVVGAAREG